MLVKLSSNCECSQDLKSLAKALGVSKLTENNDMKEIAATVFAPVDSAFRSLPVDFTNENNLDYPNITEYGRVRQGRNKDWEVLV